MVDQKWIKALSDATRLRLVKVLESHEWSVNDLVHILAMGQSRISRHLSILFDVGLVTVRRQGLWAYYRLSDLWETNRWLKVTLEEIRGDLYEIDRQKALQWEKQKKLSTRQFFDDIAARWKSLRKELIPGEDPIRRLLEDGPRVSRCADLGCGTGESLSFLLTIAERVIGIDNSLEMLALARQRFLEESRVEFRHGDIEDLPLKDGEIDLATVNLTLHHLPRLDLWAKEMGRVIKPLGYVAVVDFFPHEEERLRQVYHDYWMGLDPMEVKTLLGRYGFVVVRELSMALRADSLSLFMLLLRKEGGCDVHFS